MWIVLKGGFRRERRRRLDAPGSERRDMDMRESMERAGSVEAPRLPEEVDDGVFMDLVLDMLPSNSWPAVVLGQVVSSSL